MYYKAAAFQRTGKKFIFVIDEWDAIFHMPFITEENQKEYLLFLKALLKDKVYVKFTYMTGVLPIAKYSSGSQLNMFVEYDMTVMERFSDCFGFVEEEVDHLFDIYLKTTKMPKITREELEKWYDRYHTAAGERLYNPRSVVCALVNNQLANYWTSSGPMVIYGLLTYMDGEVFIPNKELYILQLIIQILNIFYVQGFPTLSKKSIYILLVMLLFFSIID